MVDVIHLVTVLLMLWCQGGGDHGSYINSRHTA